MPRQSEKGKVPQHVRDAYDRGFADGLRQQALPLGPGLAAPVGPCPACHALSTLATYPLGHIRLSYQDTGKVVYAKAAIRTSQWPKHYVLYTGTNYSSPADHLPGLLDKVEAVYEGRLRPSPDEYR